MRISLGEPGCRGRRLDDEGGTGPSICVYARALGYACPVLSPPGRLTVAPGDDPSERGSSLGNVKATFSEPARAIEPRQLCLSLQREDSIALRAPFADGPLTPGSPCARYRSLQGSARGYHDSASFTFDVQEP
jgi:hypothetical protein